MRITVFGLGEAGSQIAADLSRAGVDVAGFDPAPVPTPDGVRRHAEPVGAVAGTELVLAVTAAEDAPAALAQALAAIPPGALYADLATAAADDKRRLAATASAAGLVFADVALMAIVPGRGLRTPALVSGPGADAYVAALGPLGAPVVAVGDEPGEAATRKLLRSVFMKGLAAVLIEAMQGARAAGLDDWLWDNLVAEVTAAGGPMLSRLVRGTGPHARRRLHEMEASVRLLTDLGVDPVMTRSTVASLAHAVAHGVPEVPLTPDD